MQLGLVTIQRNRGPWLVEWLAFHYLVGFRKFYFYAHLCNDNTTELLTQLSRKFDITPFVINTVSDGVQLMAYQHACENHMQSVDWMCFLDGDEFLFPTAQASLVEALAPFQASPISAVGVYNRNFGSSGHIDEPAGLVIKNYTQRADDHFMAQRRIKSLVKGHQSVSTTTNSHMFATPLGTVDEVMRPVTWGYMPAYEPSYTQLCIHHYVCQSRSYFVNFKQHSGHADASAQAVREEEWWNNFNTNQVTDTTMARFAQPLRALLAEIHSELGIPVPLNA